MVEKILVVENDPMSQELSRRVLTAGGYDVVCVQNAEDALSRVACDPPDLVLMDLRLPGIDGIQAAARMRKCRATASIPVVVLSADVLPDVIARAREAGCVEYLSKPIGARELLERVGRVLAVTARADESLTQAKPAPQGRHR